ncbi:MAG: phiCTC2B 13 [Clostridiaceae bacterium]|jgi:formylmethanofuran dehydrogenase subunit E|nr:phiCTC2B 13 [Clostridiaceae bacterium]
MDNLPETCYEYRPEQPKAKIVDTCIDCGEFIYEGEEYYDIHGMIICQSCMDDYKKDGEIND